MSGARLVPPAVTLIGLMLTLSSCAGNAYPGVTPLARVAATPVADDVSLAGPANEPRLRPNPLLSRGKPINSWPAGSAGSSVVDGHYCASSAWQSATLPTWLAIHLDRGPTQILLSWNSAHTSDYIATPGSAQYAVPTDYYLETSADSTNGADGAWESVAAVEGNQTRTRAHRVPFTGATWVRMTVTALLPGTADDTLAIDQIDVHDISVSSTDTVFFMGDSITVAAHSRCSTTQPSYAEDVQAAFPAFFPAMIDGGVGGVNSSFGASVVETWLALNPDYYVWAIAYGTNDAWQSVPPDIFAMHLQDIIDAVRGAGRQPMLARIPYALRGPTDAKVKSLNAVIDTLTFRNHLQPGPDLYNWFKQHQDELGPDGVHPTDTGSRSISRLWAEALSPFYGQTR